MPPLDPDALLCEHCGYHLAGLPPDTSCPECARPVADSLPRNRPGSPWQRRRSLRSWIITIWITQAHPRAVWDSVRIDPIVTEEFAVLNVAIGLVPPSIALALAVDEHPVETLIFSIACWLLLTLVTLVAIFIEIAGIRFIGGRRDFRITSDIARTICAHASPGWIVGMVSVTGVAAAFRPINPRNVDAFQIAFLASAFIGLLAFETLVFIGMRRMKFANRPGASLTPP